ncbi:tetratricopeptide repeat protein [Alsobacter sp. KACC 23698]|uniref:Tetratricopeptide repeat protein n=1 Tax=Alsobacter sp. KACC 23698 TaxID=3149229 RepID=A0AAU7JJ59_9HYPH
MTVETDEPEKRDKEGADAPAQLRLLGPLRVLRAGLESPLPPSRKVRGLIGVLALSPHPIQRSRLTDMFWDAPDDPRGELRWALSKLRRIFDAPGRSRVDVRGDAIRLDLGDVRVDALEIAAAVQQGLGSSPPDALRRLAGLAGGDVLEGLEIERCPAFQGWLTAQRRRFRSFQAVVLERLVALTQDDDDVFAHLDDWLRISPFDRRVHERMLHALASRDRIPDGEAHLAATVRLFEAEGLDHAGLREAWRAARSRRGAGPPAAPCASSPEPPPDPGAGAPLPSAGPRRASIAVMPFARQAGTGSDAAADGLVRDVITRLAKLRSLFVIAQGTTFTLHERRIGTEEAGRRLNVDYVVGGALQRGPDRLTVSVELTETRTARIVWAESFQRRLDDAFLVLDEIGDSIVACVSSEIELTERNRAILKPPNSLDAWEAHHRGLWHMYRFNRTDNAQARAFFEAAIGLDPTFARAHAGLSFTHFQNAFQGWADRRGEMESAFAAAGRSLMSDDRDPAAHWAMGRALWLRGQHDEAVAELGQSIDLSPNFAQGHYALAFVHSQRGDPQAAVAFSDHSRRLSPYDPMLFGMLGARAMALVRLGRYEEAAEWAVRAAARPNAHAQIRAIAAFSLALAGRVEDARGYLSAIHQTVPGYRVADFLSAMQFAADDERLFRDAARRFGAD